MGGNLTVMKNDNNSIKKGRPDWHIDAKWVCGLFLIPILAVTVVVLNLYILTSRENGIKFSARVLEALYAPNANIEKSAEAVREAIKNSPDKSFTPFPDKNIKITEEDLNNYSVSELTDKIFSDLAVSIYDSPKSNMTNVGLLAPITKYGHAVLGKVLGICVAVSILFLALAIYFSADFGRLITPGILVFVISFPGTLLFYLMQKNNNQTTVPSPEAGWPERIRFIIGSLSEQIDLIYRNYLVILLFGIGFILIGKIGRIILKRRKNV